MVNAFTLSSYKDDFKIWSWVPKVEFRVNGPIESGGQLTRNSHCRRARGKIRLPNERNAKGDAG